MSRKNLSILLAWSLLFNVLFPSGVFASSAVKPGNPGFAEVEKMLDEGGNFYVYCNAKGALKQFMDYLQGVFTAPNAPPEATSALNAIEQVIDALGIYDIEGFGMSSVPVEDHYMAKTFIHIPRERRGILKVTGTKPHPCHALEYAPKDTRLLFSGDLNVGELMSLIRECLLKAGGADAAAGFDGAIDNFNMNLSQMSGREIAVQKLIASLDEEFALLIDIDPYMKINIPMSLSQSVQFPSPRFALLIRVRDASLYETVIDMIKKTGMIQNESQQGGVRKAMLFAPPNPIYALQPALAFDGQYFLLSAQSAFLDQILDTKTSGGGLTETHEYKNLMRGLPSKGNGFVFVSQKALITIQELLVKVQELSQTHSGESMPSFLFSGLEGEIAMGLASVRANMENGVWEVSKKQDINPGMTTVALGVATIGIITAISIPGFLRARETSRSSACMENLSRIDGAKEQWALEHKKPKGAEVRMEDLVGENLYIRKTPVCPRGGTYTLNIVGEDPTCSCGTRLP